MERAVLARIMIGGDDHLSSKNHGAHRDYPSECLYYGNEINKLIEKFNITHYIGAGDLTYGNFHDLDFRTKVDNLLAERGRLVNGEFYMVKGNHDKASSGTTEFEYYAKRGTFKTSETNGMLDIGLGTSGGGLHVELKDYGVKTEFTRVDGAYNLIVGHGLFAMKGDGMPNYGEPNIQLDDFAPWAGVDMIIAGHIHNEHLVKGRICNKEIAVHYLPCLCRPSYIRAGMPETGTVDIITVYEDIVEIEPITIPLLPLEVSFDLEAIAQKDAAAEFKEATKVDVADIAERLRDHVRVVNDPLSTIEHMEGIDTDVKALAIEIYKEASM